MDQKIKCAFIGFGEVNTPKEIIEEKCVDAKRELEKIGIELAVNRIVTDNPNEVEINETLKELSIKNFDFLILCIAGWIPSYPIIYIANEFSHKPMLLWGLSGHYKNEILMTTGSQAGTTAIRKILKDMDYNFKYVYNYPGSFPNMDKINNFAKSAKTLNLLKHSKIGMMGFRDMNLYGTLYDGVSLRKKIGPEIENFEMLEIVQKIKKLNVGEVAETVKDMKKEWIFEKHISDEFLKKVAEFYLAIDEKIKEKGYQAISLIDVDGMKKLLQFPPAAILMLLADKSKVCTIPENDTLGAVTQLIIKYLTGQAAAYLEFYEFMEDRVLAGVPDYVPSEIAVEPVKVLPASFGKNNEGILNISKLKTGRITLSRLASTGADYTMHIVTGKAVEPRKWEEVGWKLPAPQLPGLEIILDKGIDDFAQKVMSQHYIVSYGDNTDIIKDFCELVKVEII